eukprot:5539545-Amphidinium_carterae.1
MHAFGVCLVGLALDQRCDFQLYSASGKCFLPLPMFSSWCQTRLCCVHFASPNKAKGDHESKRFSKTTLCPSDHVRMRADLGAPCLKA